MKFELNIIQTIIHQLNPQNLNNKDFEHQFNKYKSLSDKETERIKKAFIEETFSLKKDRHIEKYIQHHQTAMIRCTDNLLKYFKPKDLNEIYKINDTPSIINLYKHIYCNLEDLLSYIESYFSKYFNLEDKIPDSYRFIAHHEFKEKLSEFNKEFNKKVVKSKCELVPIALNPINRFKSNPGMITSKYLIYLKELLNTKQDHISNLKDSFELLIRSICFL
jgi:hypothetical protein